MHILNFAQMLFSISVRFLSFLIIKEKTYMTRCARVQVQSHKLNLKREKGKKQNSPKGVFCFRSF